MAGTIHVTVLEVSQLTEESRPGHSAIVRSASAPGISNGHANFETAAVREIEANMATMHGAWYPGKHFQRLVSPHRTQTSGSARAAAALGLRLGDRELRTSPVPGGSGRVGEAFVFRFSNQATDVLRITAHANDTRSITQDPSATDAPAASATAVASSSALAHDTLTCNDGTAWFAGVRGALPCGVCALPLARFPVATKRSSSSCCSASPNNAATISQGSSDTAYSSRSSTYNSSEDQNVLGQADPSHSSHSLGAQKVGHESGCSSDHVEKWFSLLHPTNPSGSTLKAAVKLRLHIVLDGDVDDQSRPAAAAAAAAAAATHGSSSVFPSIVHSVFVSGLPPPPLNTSMMIGASSFNASAVDNGNRDNENSAPPKEPPSPSTSPPPVLDPGVNTGHQVSAFKNGAGFKRPPSPRLLSSPRPGGSTASLRSSGSNSRHEGGRSPPAGLLRPGTRKSLPSPAIGEGSRGGAGGSAGAGVDAGSSNDDAIGTAPGSDNKNYAGRAPNLEYQGVNQQTAPAPTENRALAGHEVAQQQEQHQQEEQEHTCEQDKEQQQGDELEMQEQQAATDLAWCGAQVMPSGLVDYLAVVRGRPVTQHLHPGEEVKDPTASYGSNEDESPLQVCDAVVTERWPRDDSAAAVPFPAKLEWFCFPSGWRPITRKHRSNSSKVPRPSSPPAPRSTTFCLQLGGSKAWGVCVVGCEPKPHAQWIAQSSHQDPHNNSSSSSGSSEWWPVCVCLLTRLPVVSALKAWLRDFLEAVLLYRRFNDSSNALTSCGSRANTNSIPPLKSSLLSWLAPRWADLALLLPHPIEGRLAVSADPFGLGRRLKYGHGGRLFTDTNGVAVAQHSLRRPSPLLPSLPHDPNDCRQALACLGSPKMVLEVIACLLGERKVLLHSRTLNVLPPLADMLVSLLYPMPWPHAFVPVLPRPMLGVLAAPTPFLLGVHSTWLRELEATPEVAADLLADVVLVDIDGGRLDFSYCAPVTLPLPQGGLSTYQIGTNVTSSSSTTAEAAPPLLPPSAERCLLEALQEYLRPDGQPSDNPCAFLVSDQFATATAATVAEAIEAAAAGNRRTEGNASDASHVTTTTGSTHESITMAEHGDDRAQGEKLAALRLSFAWALSSLFQDVEKCVFWVDTAWPVFDAARFLSACTLSHDVPALRGIVATQSFHLLLESWAREPSLAFFRYAIARQRVGSSANSSNCSGGGGKSISNSSSSSSSSRSRSTLNVIDVELEHGSWSPVPWCLNVPAPTDKFVGISFEASTRAVSSPLSSSTDLSGQSLMHPAQTHNDYDKSVDMASLEALVNSLPDDERDSNAKVSWLNELRALGVESAADCALLVPSELHEVVGMPLSMAETLHAVASVAAAASDSDVIPTAAAAADTEASLNSCLGVFPSEPLLDCDWLDEVARCVEQQVFDTHDPHQEEEGGNTDYINDEKVRKESTGGLEKTPSQDEGIDGKTRTPAQTAAPKSDANIRPPPLLLSENSDDFYIEGQTQNNAVRASRRKINLCWTVEAVAATTGASVWDLVPPDDESEVEYSNGIYSGNDDVGKDADDARSDSEEWNGGMTRDESHLGSSSSNANVLGSATPSTPPRKTQRRSIAKSISDSILANSSSSSNSTGAVLARSPRNRKLSNPSLLLPLSPGMSSNPYNFDQQSTDRDLSAEEQRLLQCVALALSAEKGPPSALLAATRADLHAAGEDLVTNKPPTVKAKASKPSGDTNSSVTSPSSFAVAERLLRILERMHAQQEGPEGCNSSRSSSHLGQHGKSRRLPRAGFECLAALCDSALVAAAQRERWAFPFALLRAAAFYHQDLAITSDEIRSSSSSGIESGGLHNLNNIGRSSGNGISGNGHGGELRESLGARVSEHRVFVDPLLWESELKHQLLSFAGGTRGWNHAIASAALAPLSSDGSGHNCTSGSSPDNDAAVATKEEEGKAAPLVATGADPRTVVQQLTALIFAMRAVRSMTPHRAALFVRRVVHSYGLTESHARSLLAVVRSAWRDVVHLPPSAFDDVAWLHNAQPNQHHQQHYHHPPLASSPSSSSPALASLSAELEGLLFGGSMHNSFDYSHPSYSRSNSGSSSSGRNLAAFDGKSTTRGAARSTNSSSHSNGSSSSTAYRLNGSAPCASAVLAGVPLLCLAAWSDYTAAGCADGTVRAALLLANHDNKGNSSSSFVVLQRDSTATSSSSDSSGSINAGGVGECNSNNDVNVAQALSTEDSTLHVHPSELIASSQPSPMPLATMEPLEMEDEDDNAVVAESVPTAAAAAVAPSDAPPVSTPAVGTDSATAPASGPGFRNLTASSAPTPGPFPATELFRAATMSARQQLFRSHSAAPLSSPSSTAFPATAASEPAKPVTLAAAGSATSGTSRPAFAVVAAHGSPITRVACAGRFVLSGDANGGLKVTTLPSSSALAAPLNPTSKEAEAPSLSMQQLQHSMKPKGATKSPVKSASSSSSSSVALGGHKSAVTCLAVPIASTSPALPAPYANVVDAAAATSAEPKANSTTSTPSTGQMVVAAPLFVSGAADGTVKVWNFAAAAHPSHRDPVAVCEPRRPSLSPAAAAAALSAPLATTIGHVVSVSRAADTSLPRSSSHKVAGNRGLQAPAKVASSAASLEKGNSFNAPAVSTTSRSSAPAFLAEDASVTSVNMGLDTAVVAAGYAHGRVCVWALNSEEQRPPMAGGGTSAVGASSVRARGTASRHAKSGSSRNSGAPIPKARVVIDCAAHALAVRCVRLRYLNSSSSSSSSNDNDEKNEDCESNSSNVQGCDAGDYMPRGQLLTGSNDCTARLWDFRVPQPSSSLRAHYQSTNNSSTRNSSGSAAAVVFGGHCAPVTCLEDGVGVCSGGRDVITGCADGLVRVFDLRQPRQAKLELRSSDVMSGACTLVALHRFTAARLPSFPSGVNGEESSEERLLSAARNGSVCEWDLATGKLLRQWRVGSSSFHSNGDRVSGFEDMPFLAAYAATETGFVGTSGLGVVQRWDLA